MNIIGLLRPVYVAFTLTAVSASVPGTAQDVAPETPSELRDFKLDPEKAPPVWQPLPTTEPVAKPVVKPAVTAAPIGEVPPVRIPAARAQSVKPALAKAAIPRSRGAGPQAEAKSMPSPAVKNTEPVRVLTPDPVPIGANELAANKGIPATQAVPNSTDGEAISAVPAPPFAAATLPWQWILAALMLAMGAAVTFLVHRRKATHDIRNIMDPVKVTDDGRHINAPDMISELTSIPKFASAPFGAAISAIRPKLEIRFVPEKASISVANLTIKGRLHIVNSGADSADAMRLNAAVISASNGQAAAISRYFAGAMPPGKELGAAKPGEQIALEMDLMIPIADLQTFVAGDQKLLVPIILARLSYQWGDATQQDLGLQRDEAQLSCLIGRESAPPKPKMGALRLDLGPRNFVSLGQRPVLA